MQSPKKNKNDTGWIDNYHVSSGILSQGLGAIGLEAV